MFVLFVICANYCAFYNWHVSSVYFKLEMNSDFLSDRAWVWFHFRVEFRVFQFFVKLRSRYFCVVYALHFNNKKINFTYNISICYKPFYQVNKISTKYMYNILKKKIKINNFVLFGEESNISSCKS